MGFLCANVHKTHAQGGFKWTVTHLGGMNNSKMKMWCFFCSNKLDIKEILCISSKSNRTSLLSYGHQSVYIACVCVYSICSQLVLISGIGIHSGISCSHIFPLWLRGGIHSKIPGFVPVSNLLTS